MDTYEKKYKEAINKAEEIIRYYKERNRDEAAIEDLKEIFPELKESEDEKIRKELIDFVKSRLAGFPECKRFTNWLEKQGEQKPILDFKAKDWYVSKVDGKIHNIYHSVDKVEPKFKVGDWLVNNERKHIIKVVNPTPLVYEVVNILGYHHTITNTAIENNYHLWTIQDAKDGDVLCCESGWTCIFKTLVNDETFSSYCFMDNTKWFCETGSECHTLNKEFMKVYNGEIKPATKEQRDLLFQKMHKDGYEWDAEKKELKKIENASDNENQKLGEFISELSKQFPEVSFAKLSRIAVRVAKWVERNKCNK